MISGFFIDRPKFAFVISILITLAGLVSLYFLPINMYPNMAPPQVKVLAYYPGASADVIEQSVIRPLEERINGVEDMLYIESVASNSGAAEITVTFRSGADENMAQVNVQNRVAIANQSLPEEVIRQGVTVSKQSNNMLMGITIYSEDNDFDELFVSNYVSNNVTDSLARIEGVSKVEMLGKMSYSMRIWLNPDRMNALDITVSDVEKVLREQNTIIAAGKIGQEPTLPNQQFEYSIQTQGRLDDPEVFGEVIVKAASSGGIVRLKDIASIELGSENYSIKAKLNNKPTSLLMIYLLPSANASKVGADIYKELNRLSASFPAGIKYKVPYDTTRFIRSAIHEVEITLYQAIFLVVLVVFLFLQSVRATLIPVIAIPVSLIGTFAALQILGYSLNTVTLFGLVLAIGVVVDDAIVVIENVERLIRVEKMPARLATIQAMKEVTGPIIATTLVLLAVFVPVAFMPGITGTIYKQFSVTISVAVIISSINALTLSPALCSVLLKDNSKPLGILNSVESFIGSLTNGYGKIVGWMLRRSFLMGILFIVLFISAGFMLKIVPTGFVPEEDQGFLFVDVLLPDAASANRTSETLSRIGELVLKQDGVSDFISVSGFSLLGGSSSNSGFGIVVLDDWSKREKPELKLGSILKVLQGRLWAMADSQAIVFNVPAIPGLGTTSGFDFRLQDTMGRDSGDLNQVLKSMIYEANQNKQLSRVFSTSRSDVPQYLLEVDRNKIKVQGVSMMEVFMTLQAQLGSFYINDFSKFGRIYKVIIQAESNFRSKPEDLDHFYVRNNEGNMVPISTLVSLSPVLGPVSISHFNLYRSATINGQAATGFSSSDAITAMAKLAKGMPDGYKYSWAGQSLQEIESGNLVPLLFCLALVCIYLFLVAQYESWSVPFVVMSSAPLAILGALVGVFLFGMVNNIYAQIGLIMLVGISSKTAILIVEFALANRKKGESIQQSAKKAAKLRFRAVLMTSLSFVLGVLPLVLSTGAGSMSHRSLGTPVFFGMIATTIFSTLLIPIIFKLVQSGREKICGEVRV